MKFDMEINEAGVRRFWSIQCNQNNDVTICHGRVGGKGALFLKNFSLNQEAIDYVQQAVKSKQSIGYKFIKNSRRVRKMDQHHKKNLNDEVVSSQRRRSPRLTKKNTKKPRKQLRRKNEAVNTQRVANDPEVQSELRQYRVEATQTKQKKQRSVAPNLSCPQQEVDPRIRMSYRYNILDKDDFHYTLLTKTNTSYYIVQILVDQQNTNNIKVYSRWGLHGSIGRFQLTKCRDVQHALDLFALKFADKTGRCWYERSCYRPKRGKYVWINPTQDFVNDDSDFSTNNTDQTNNENFSSTNYTDEQQISQNGNFCNNQQSKQKLLENNQAVQQDKQNEKSVTIGNTIQTNCDDYTTCSSGVSQMDVDVQEGNILLDNLVQKILSPTLSDFENEDFFQPISCQ